MRTSKKPRGNRSIYNACFEACEQRLLMSTYTVNTTSDAVNPGTGLLTLRQAIADANSSTANDVINFSPTAFKTGSVHTITLTQGQLSMIGTTTIDGPSSGNVTIDANHGSRAFQISQGSLITIENLTITNGLIAPAAGQPAYGGAITNAGYLELYTVQVTNSNASGGSYVYTSTNLMTGVGGDAAGGAIYSTGQLVIKGSTLSGNTAQGGGSYEYDNDIGSANSTQGGAVYSSGSLAITSSTITHNSAIGGQSDGYYDSSGTSDGGGVYDSGTLTITASTLSDNTSSGGGHSGPFYSASSGANASGGGLYVSGNSVLTSVVVTGNAVNGSGDGGEAGAPGVASGGGIYNTGALTADHLTINGNTASSGEGPIDDNGPGADAFGGGIASTSPLNLSSSSITNNIASGGFGRALSGESESNAFGGGIYTTSTLTLVASTLSGNTAQGDPGGGRYAGDGGQGQGGGLFSSYAANVSSSTITGNTARGGIGDPPYSNGTAGSGGAGEGGGIFNSYGTLTITNSTLTTNTAIGGQGGPGGYNGGNGGNGGDGVGGAIDSTGGLTLYDTTLSGNTAVGGAGGILQPYAGSGYHEGQTGRASGAGMTISSGYCRAYNSIISANLDNGSIEDDIFGQLNGSSSYNLLGTGSGLTNGEYGNITNINHPQLAPLGNYGGPTQTMPPTSASPVLNAGGNSYIPSGVTTDQRGDPRITAGTVDIGSVELQTGSVSGTIFNDLNGDGIRQTGEPVLANVTVYADLSNSGSFKPGDPVTSTNSSGNYTLNGLPEGALIIRQQAPSGYRQTYPAATAGEHVTVTPAGVTGALFADSTKLYVAGTVKLSGVPQSGVVVYADLNNDGKFESIENNKTTASDGTYAFVGLAAGTYTFRIVPPAGDTVTGNIATTISLASGGVDGGVNFTLAQSTQTQLTGTIIGTTGSYQNEGNTIAKAFDGNLSTFFDGPTANGNYAGLDLGSAQPIGAIAFAPRTNYATRMVGGIFQGANSANFANAVNLYTITAAPAVGLLTNVPITNTTAFRYLRYLSPNGSYGNIAELQFLSVPTTSAGASLGPTGLLTVTGTSGADQITITVADYIAFNDGPSTITVQVNGQTQVFIPSSINGIVINSGNGNDTVTLTGEYELDPNGYDPTNRYATTINCGDGNDAVTTELREYQEDDSPTSVINLGAGKDSVDVYQDGSATLNGGAGSDTLDTSADAILVGLDMYVNGGAGNMTVFEGPNVFVQTFHGGAGINTFWEGPLYDIGGINRNLNGPDFSNIQYFNDSQGDVASIEAGPTTVQIYSTASTPKITGSTGNLFIEVEAEDPTIIAGSGNTTVLMSATDGGTLTGGSGNDTFYVTPGSGPVTINGGGGFNTAYTNANDITVSNVQSLNPKSNVLTGTLLATPGSYQNDGNTAAHAVDGNLTTYFNAPTANGNYVGYDLGTDKLIQSISYAPRPGFEQRMVGGIFQFSDSADFSDPTYIASISSLPLAGQLTTISLSQAVYARYVRYLAPDGSFGNIAELRFASPGALTGTPIGTPGSYHNLGNTITNVFDNNPATYFDGPDATGDWVGLDLGSAQIVTQVAYDARNGYANRMVGGMIQASTSANFSTGVVTLATLHDGTDIEGDITLNNQTAYRYYRYLGPTGSFCNIADLTFEG